MTWWPLDAASFCALRVCVRLALQRGAERPGYLARRHSLPSSLSAWGVEHAPGLGFFFCSLRVRQSKSGPGRDCRCSASVVRSDWHLAWSHDIPRTTDVAIGRRYVSRISGEEATTFRLFERISCIFRDSERRKGSLNFECVLRTFATSQAAGCALDQLVRISGRGSCLLFEPCV